MQFSFFFSKQWHTRRSNFTFDTLQGQAITKGLEQLSKRFDLDALFGTAPHDFTISRYAPSPFFPPPKKKKKKN